jgi:hypothetical protein
LKQSYHAAVPHELPTSDLADTGRCAVAIAVTTSKPIGRWPITVDAEGNMSIGFLGMSDQEAIPAARLPRAELTNLADLLNTARRGTPAAERTGQPDRGPEVEWPPVPPAPEPEPWARGTDAAGGLLTDEAEQWPDRAGTVGHPDQADEERDPTDDEAPDPDQTRADTRSPNPLQTAANPHVFIHSGTARRTTQTTYAWINKTLGMHAQALREDRIVDEVAATSGDVRRICDMFGLSVGAALRYTATADQPRLTEYQRRTTPPSNS